MNKHDQVSLRSRTDRSASMGGEATRTVEAVVFVVIPEYEQVKVKDVEGHIYSLTPMTRGVDLLALHEGQRVLCEVTCVLPRVLSAEVIV